MNAWLARTRQRAAMPPSSPRQPLLVGAAKVGSVEPAVAQRLRDAGLPLREAAVGWQVVGETDAALARIAGALREAGLAGKWRDELLAVNDGNGQVLGAIERAVARRLGITTHAVHLVGHDPAGGCWVQQRALDKATDPGLWDTLMGGLMAAGESVATTLERETWEEAGLRLEQLAGLRPQGQLTIRRPVAEGYMVERIHIATATVPAGVVPRNLDGEVERFECIGRPLLEARLLADEFTLEAALVLAQALHLGEGGRG
jgi:8-oxo-dGTP pyrophosphatase MutT (NUDIX family)